MLLLHLDGVGRKQLEFAMERGYAPTLRGLLERGPYRLSPCRAGAPTSTPAFQAGMLYGVGSDIPGYTWFDKRRGREIRMDRAEDARMLERDLAARGVPLLQNGSVYCSIFSGGAPLRRWALSGWNEQLCAEDFGMEALSRGPLLPQARDVVAATLVHSATLGRIFGALGMDVASGAVETARWVRHIGSMQHEPKFLLHRVLTECLFAEFAANSCVIDIARGTPIVYACFIGYDEYAHRRGPYSRMALLKLWELDRMLGRIIAAAKALPELNYELYLFSDHGNAVLSRFPISHAQNYDLSVPRREPRGCLRADLALPDGRSLHLFDLHLGLSGGERRRQAAMLLSADLLRDTALTAPLVVCGDFNMWSPLPGPILRLLRTALRDAAQVVGARRSTWPSALPLLRLDRAYVDDGVEVLASGVINDPRTRAASDHLPLWVELLPRPAEALAVGRAGA
jgi:endonuclease/exonuclease/phosphatase family metal-dependent hydrolase